MHNCETHFLISNNNTIKSYTIYQIVTIVIFTSFIYSFGGRIIGVRMAVLKPGFKVNLMLHVNGNIVNLISAAEIKISFCILLLVRR